MAELRTLLERSIPANCTVATSSTLSFAGTDEALQLDPAPTSKTDMSARYDLHQGAHILAYFECPV